MARRENPIHRGRFMEEWITGFWIRDSKFKITNYK